MLRTRIPALRFTAGNRAGVNAGGGYVLYWMIAYRRVGWNFALERAVEWARALHKPLLVLEALGCDYPWASDRLHRFILDGMKENRRRLAGTAALYYPYVEPGKGMGKGLLATLARRACVVVTDEFPCSSLPRMVAAAARQTPVRLELVDSNGLLPLRAADKYFSTAHSFRRFLQLNLFEHLHAFPRRNPLAGAKLPRLRSLPGSVMRRWPPASEAMLAGKAETLAKLPVDHSVAPVAARGGTTVAEKKLRRFLRIKLPRYLDDRLRVDEEATSGLSPWLHFGHISAHQIFHELMKREKWGPARLGPQARGSRTGWWGVSAPAEAFLDQLATWRELGFNGCFQRRDYDRYSSLPPWARATLHQHAVDPRPYRYRLEELEHARTHDAIWNFAQCQLHDTGRIHNYLRMLWGKKILEWTRSPREALRVMIELNNKYAIDGRDPNSYSGIFWCLGRYDRPWGPERAIFGTVRYMSSESARRKLRGLP